MGCFVALFIMYLKICLIEAEGNCPDNLPLEIDGLCYRLYTDFNNYKEAKDNCQNLDSLAIIANNLLKTPNILARKVKEFIRSKIEKSSFWIGFKMEDRSMSKSKEDRDWTFDYDGETVVEKDFELWAEPPRESGLSCAIVNGSNNFDVSAVDCGGPRLPVVCMRDKDSACQDDVKPYLRYGEYCIAAITAALEYNKIHGACHPDIPSPVKSQKMKKYVLNAVLNSFIGGAIYMGIEKYEGIYVYTLTGFPIPEKMWGEGEPREEYECAGLALQFDGSVKLRTLSCDFLASSLCYVAVFSAFFFERAAD